MGKNSIGCVFNPFIIFDPAVRETRLNSVGSPRDLNQKILQASWGLDNFLVYESKIPLQVLSSRKFQSENIFKKVFIVSTVPTKVCFNCYETALTFKYFSDTFDFSPLR